MRMEKANHTESTQIPASIAKAISRRTGRGKSAIARKILTIIVSRTDESGDWDAISSKLQVFLNQG